MTDLRGSRRRRETGSAVAGSRVGDNEPASLRPGPVDLTLHNIALPPSVNSLYYGDHTLTAAHRSWRKTFGHELMAVKARPFIGRWTLEVIVPEKMRGDVDNRIKAVSDALVKFEIVPDDRFMDKAECRRSVGRSLKDGCMIIVRKSQGETHVAGPNGCCADQGDASARGSAV